MIFSLKTKRERLFVERFIGEVINSVTKERVLTETSDGEGEGEVSFENITILGNSDGEFSVSGAVEVPATRWEPPTVDVVEIGIVGTLHEAMILAIKTYIDSRVEAAIEGEVTAVDYGAYGEEMEEGS
jgi:hypothetical protein